MSVLDGCFLWVSRIVIPAEGRDRVLEQLHECIRLSAESNLLLAAMSGDLEWIAILSSWLIPVTRDL